jgi:uroporphyrinogen decarboxylase
LFGFLYPHNDVEMQTLMMNQPEVLRAMLEHLTEALTVYVRYQIEAGAQIVQLFDSWAHHLSPKQFREFSLPYAQKIIADVRTSHPDTPLIFHANGGVGKLAALQSCTADVIGLDWSTDMHEARSELPGKVLQGNVDPMVLFGTEEKIRGAVEECMAAGGDEHHILNVGHGVVQGTPEENVKLFVQLARESTRQPALAVA